MHGICAYDTWSMSILIIVCYKLTVKEVIVHAVEHDKKEWLFLRRPFYS